MVKSSEPLASSSTDVSPLKTVGKALTFLAFCPASLAGSAQSTKKVPSPCGSGARVVACSNIDPQPGAKTFVGLEGWGGGASAGQPPGSCGGGGGGVSPQHT